jgi:hypothetical protein
MISLQVSICEGNLWQKVIANWMWKWNDGVHTEGTKMWVPNEGFGHHAAMQHRGLGNEAEWRNISCISRVCGLDLSDKKLQCGVKLGQSRCDVCAAIG